MTIIVAVPKGGDADDVLAARGHAALNKMKAGRDQWIEGTLELATFLQDLRVKYPDHREFSRWLKRYGFQEIDARDRSALIKLAEDPGARTLLEQSTGRSLHHIWYERPNKPPRTLVRLDKGVNSRGRRPSGYEQRKRATRIPDVMREDYEPPQDPQPRPTTRRQPRIPDVMREPPPPPKKQSLTEYFLTPEQIDPDFKGTALEFATKYGHVPLQTKEQIELVRRQETLSAWLGSVADHARTAQVMLTALAAVDPATLQQWLSKPSKTEKLRAWCNSMEVACEAIRKLKGIVS